MKLPWNIFVEAAIDESNRIFHFHRQRKLPRVSMHASTNFHGSNLLPSTSIEISMDVNLRPPMSMEVSMEMKKNLLP